MYLLHQLYGMLTDSWILTQGQAATYDPLSCVAGFDPLSLSFEFASFIDGVRRSLLLRQTERDRS